MRNSPPALRARVLLFAALARASAASPQPPATLAASAINLTTFLERADMLWDWELHCDRRRCARNSARVVRVQTIPPLH